MSSISRISPRAVGESESRREARPFVWLQPSALPSSLPADAAKGLEALNAYLGDAVPQLVRNLVQYSLVSSQDRTRSQAPSASVLNRRRRSARLWINSVLAGSIDANTINALVMTWGPQLAGTGPNPRRAVRRVQGFVEFLRGNMTALICDEPEENLVPQAQGICALEAVLGVHLGALRRV
ncbi:MAG: hypothetical protein ACYTG5_03815 [Planctomycetota bacterium]|jgi:hypothetical protein